MQQNRGSRSGRNSKWGNRTSPPWCANALFINGHCSHATRVVRHEVFTYQELTTKSDCCVFSSSPYFYSL